MEALGAGDSQPGKWCWGAANGIFLWKIPFELSGSKCYTGGLDPWQSDWFHLHLPVMINSVETPMAGTGHLSEEMGTGWKPLPRSPGCCLF